MNLFNDSMYNSEKISLLSYEKADFEHVQELEHKVKKGIKQDRLQDNEISDIKEMILELYTTQRAIVRYMERNHDFEHEAFEQILEEINNEDIEASNAEE